MRAWRWTVAGVAVLGVAVGAWFLKPVTGPARDLSLQGDATRGAYLITLGGCVACHTDAKNKGGELAGGPALKTAFGIFHAPNITPDPQAGIGKWTPAQFAEAMSNGNGPGFENQLYPVFPYDSYTLMSDQEIADLYAGLQQVPADPTPSQPHEVSFPFNLRIFLAGWKNLFFKPERYRPDPARSDRWNRGRYLVYGPGHCVACHTPRNLLGGRDDAQALTGSAGGPAGNVPGITGARLTRQGFDQTSLIEALTTGFTPGFDVLGGAMGEVIDESTSRWHQDDLEAVAAYLFDQD